METKRSSNEINQLRIRWGFTNCFSDDSNGRKGGLALLCWDDTDIRVHSYSTSRIDVHIGRDSGVNSQHFIRFYGHPKTSKREESQSLLCTLKAKSNLPWLCVGDFNEILIVEKKVGGNVRPEQKMVNFMEVVEECELFELPLEGLRLTWSRGKGPKVIYERLVRGFCTKDQQEIFPQIVKEHLMVTTSDHLPLCFHVSKYHEQK